MGKVWGSLAFISFPDLNYKIQIMKKIAFIGFALFGILSFLQAQKDSLQQPFQPKNGFGRFLDGAFGHIAKTPIPQGKQWSILGEFGTIGAGFGVDCRTRTSNRYFDWAWQAGVGGYDYTYNPEFGNIKKNQNIGTHAGISGLWGKRAWSFELGLQGSFAYNKTEYLEYRDYITQEDYWFVQPRIDYYLAAPVGVRFQPIRGGVFFAFNMAPQYGGNTLIRADNKYTIYWGSNISSRISLGYTFPTKNKIKK